MTHFQDVAAFPLCWPEGWARTKNRDRGSRFGDWTVYTATEGLTEELRKMAVTQLIVSTSVPLRKDGLPLSKPPVDGDPGVAIYFLWRKQPWCIACDRYTEVADNIRALTLTIEAFRTIERHGSSELLNRSFTGFAALPSGGPSWWDVLKVSPDASRAVIDNAFRTLAKQAHPDTGGSHEAMSALNDAYEKAKAAKESQ